MCVCMCVMFIQATFYTTIKTKDVCMYVCHVYTGHFLYYYKNQGCVYVCVSCLYRPLSH